MPFMHPQMGDKSSAPFQNLGARGSWIGKILPLPLKQKKNGGRRKVVQKTKSLPWFLIRVLWDCHTQVKQLPCFLTGKLFLFLIKREKEKKKKVELKVIHPSAAKTHIKNQYPNERFVYLEK